MSGLKTSLKLLRLARQGCSLRDWCLAFLCLAVGVMGSHRRRLRHLFVKAISLYSQAGEVCLHFKLYGRMMEINMREGNEADYLVAGELIAGGYILPIDKRFVPTAIVDGGANIGTFALQASARFPNVALKCYEPDPANLEQLRLNLARNGIKAEIVPKALWSENTELFFHADLSYTGFVSPESSSHPISCELPQIPDGCWLKLDIEGAEYEVLPALLRQQARPAIISLEIHDFVQRGNGLLAALRQHGYSIHGSFKRTDLCVTVCAYKSLM
jgi:FkbM family methyltransferase